MSEEDLILFLKTNLSLSTETCLRKNSAGELYPELTLQLVLGDRVISEQSLSEFSL